MRLITKLNFRKRMRDKYRVGCHGLHGLIDDHKSIVAWRHIFSHKELLAFGVKTKKWKNFFQSSFYACFYDPFWKSNKSGLTCVGSIVNDLFWYSSKRWMWGGHAVVPPVKLAFKRVTFFVRGGRRDSHAFILWSVNFLKI